MKVAVIEDNGVSQKLIRSMARHFDWDIDFFVSSSDFGQARLSEYDVILADYGLNSINGRDLIKSIASKTTAQMFLMSDSTGSFLEEDVENDRIKGLIDKADPHKIIDELKYVESKLRLKSILENEKDNLGSLIPTNGYSIESSEGIGILRITELLTNKTRGRLLDEIQQLKIHDIILSFSIQGIISSPYLSFIIFLYKELKKLSGRLVIWDEMKNEELTDQISLCNLSLLVPVFGSIEESLNYFKKHEELT